MNKKGVEISMNVIIIAAIGLMVLVVLSAIFLGRIGVFSQSTADCSIQGGICAERCGDIDVGSEDYLTPNPSIKCKLPDGEPGVCCLKVATQ
ncbi:hypothetical protein JXB27_00840 [Candidatus Woesearchaeota archaeon]|nr:hypothetical protein [Candidatus Woesearchaeota archaeon]